jgi:hypothetical protein
LLLFSCVRLPYCIILAIISLNETAEACSLVLGTLTSTSAAVGPTPSSLPPLAVIRTDLLSYLTLIYNSTTKITLALKPPKGTTAPSYTAALSPIQDLTRHVLAANACVSLLNDSAHGATLVQDVRVIIAGVAGAVRELMQTLVAVLDGSEGGTDAHLVRIGAVHELVDRAKGPEGVPVDNFTAVRRRWAGDRGTMEDAMSEVTGMIEDAEAGDADDGGFDDDEGDGWDELGLGGKKMDKLEVARVKEVCDLALLMIHANIDH